jgi:glycosyltransferase involved in cell wall biosynthesis
MIRKKRHIAYVSFNQFDPFLRDGGSISILSRLQFLKKQGNRVSVLNFLANNVPDKLFDNALADGNRKDVIREERTCSAVFMGLDYYEEVLPCGFGQQSNEYRTVLKAIMQIIRQRNIDYVLTADECFLPLLASWLLRIPGAQLFNSLATVQVFEKNNTYVRFLQKRAVFANSQFIQAQIKERLGIASVVWHTFINLYAYQGHRDIARTNTIGFCSRGKNKGGAIVAEIIRRMPERSFIVVGTHYGSCLDNSPRNLTCLGHISEMRKFYGQIDLLLVPSLLEDAFPRVILEAAGNGIPVIATRVGGIPEALGGSGILIDWAHDKEPDIAKIANEYVREIRRVLGDDNVYEYYRQKAFAREKQFELEQTRMAQEIYDKYF